MNASLKSSDKNFATKTPDHLLFLRLIGIIFQITNKFTINMHAYYFI